MTRSRWVVAAGITAALWAASCGSGDSADEEQLAPYDGEGGSSAAGSAGAKAGASGSGQGGASGTQAGQGGQSSQGGQAGEGASGGNQAGQAGQTGGAGQAGQGAGGQAGTGQAGTGQAGSGQAGSGPADPTQKGAHATAVWKGTLGSGFGAPAIWVTYPTDGGAGVTYPLVLFAHGFQLGVGDYQTTLEHIASHGYVVASVDYASSFFDQDHHAPVDSMKLALDLLLTSPPAEVGPIADGQKVASMGHSLGGKAAVWAGLELEAIKAVVALDPVDDNPVGQPTDKRPSLAPEKMGAMKVPNLYLGAQLSPQATFGMACAPKASNACTFAASVPSGVPVVFDVLEDFGHMQFLDNPACLVCATCAKGTPGSEANDKLLVRTMSVAFLGRYLLGLPYDDYLTGSFVDKAKAANVVLDQAELGAFCQ